MPTTEEVKKAVEQWVKAIEDPEVAEEFEGYNKTLQMIFPDIDAKMQLIFDGAKITIVEGEKTDAEMSITVDAEVFMGFGTGEVDPMDAFMQGKLKPAGDLQSLEKLEVLLSGQED